MEVLQLLWSSCDPRLVDNMNKNDIAVFNLNTAMQIVYGCRQSMSKNANHVAVFWFVKAFYKGSSWRTSSWEDPVGSTDQSPVQHKFPKFGWSMLHIALNNSLWPTLFLLDPSGQDLSLVLVTIICGDVISPSLCILTRHPIISWKSSFLHEKDPPLHLFATKTRLGIRLRRNRFCRGPTSPPLTRRGPASNCALCEVTKIGSEELARQAKELACGSWREYLVVLSEGVKMM